MASLLIAIIYYAFINLGLSASQLGAGWPAMHGALGVPLSYSGALSVLICLGNISANLLNARLVRRLGTPNVTCLSALLMVCVVFGFSKSTAFWQLCLLAVLYGVGACNLDVALNNYIALHYSSRHMSWSHCMWGVGSAIGPHIMGYALSSGRGWSLGYGYVAIIQSALVLILFFCRPLWQKGDAATPVQEGRALSFRETVSIPGVKPLMLLFFCYSALEQVISLWASSYLVLHRGIPAETAAGFMGIFFLGITIGRALSGFLTLKLDDGQMVFLGQGIIALGVIILFLSLGNTVCLAGLMLVGLGCAPIYPCAAHMIPSRFGAAHSRSIVGVSFASGNLGNCLMSPLFGLLAGHGAVSLFPVYLAVMLCCMVAMAIRLRRMDIAA